MNISNWTQVSYFSLCHYHRVVLNCVYFIKHLLPIRYLYISLTKLILYHQNGQNTKP